MNSIIAKYREIKEDNPLRIAYSKRKENMVTNYNTDTLNDCPKSTFRTVWRGELKSILSDKIKRLGIPFLVFTALAFVLKFLFPGDMNRTVSFTPVEIIKAIANPFEGPLNEMWFIMTIMWFFVLTPL